MAKRHWFAWIMVILSLVSISATTKAATLDEGFSKPPASARPHTWWHWMNGNITKEGITADLESMARVGVGGAQIFNVDCEIPAGPINYMTPEWLELVHHAVKEADRVGVEICFHNCAGWSSSGGPWITPEYGMQIVVYTETKVSGPGKVSVKLNQPTTRKGYYKDIFVLAFPQPGDDAYRIADIAPKAGFDSQYNMLPNPAKAPDKAIVALDSVLNLSDKMDASGQLNWDAPAGQWVVIRMGHTPTGKTNHPAPKSGEGLECDKLSREAMDVHWNGGIKPVLDKLGPLAGKALNNILIDSYEVGSNNWTAKLRDEFKQRRGYDLLNYLPALTGRVITSSEVTERFLWDFRRTLGDLFAENYYGYFIEKCHKAGLLCSVEPYDGPFECLAVGKGADIIMGEFWVRQGINHSVKLAASVAHTHGVTVVGAESFTASPDDDRWQNYPGSLKALGEQVWCRGVNRYIFHRYAMQPWMDKLPGMTMGQWGTHFDRTNTWWEQGKAWMAYIARSQYLLQQGRFAADVLFFAGESAPNGSEQHDDLKAAGYDYDVCGTDLIGSIKVDNGQVALPSGMRYNLLVINSNQYMTPRLAGIIRDLVKAGATVIANKPSFSPSLSDYPRSDAAVKAIADEVWGAGGGNSGQKAFGKGQVVWGRKPLEVLQTLKVQPDCLPAGKDAKMNYIHRIVGDTDIYFVANPLEESQTIDCFFRVKGRQPELWDSQTGVMIKAGLWKSEGQGTRVTLPLGPAGSVFVVFREPAASGATFAAMKFEGNSDFASQLQLRQNTLEIVEARYGQLSRVGEDQVDVTDIVSAMVKDNRLAVDATNGLAGDPAVNVVKAMFVDYEYGGKAGKATVAENQRLILPPAGAAAGGALKIVAAGYGKMPAGDKWFNATGFVDVTAKVKAAVKDNALAIAATNEFAGKDPANMSYKQMRISYRINAQPGVKIAGENSQVRLPEGQWQPAAWQPRMTAEGVNSRLLAWDNGRYVLQTAAGQSKTIEVTTVPELIQAQSEWSVRFTPGWGAPESITLPELKSWTENENAGVRYYSGTAVYTSKLHISPDYFRPYRRLYLDLGQVGYLAEVIVNGRNLGILWVNPYRLDITDAAKAGDNDLEVRITNLWPNRLIGDEQYPDDREWNGKQLKAWPEWFVKGQPRPVKERLTFTTWRHWRKNDALLPSGLLGPVYVRAGDQVDVVR